MTEKKSNRHFSEKHFPRLIADIGGTNARFAIETAPLQLEKVMNLSCDAFSTFLAATQHYLAAHSLAIPRHACVAIANPVNGDSIKMTNHQWCFSIRAVKQQLGMETLLFVNDFQVQALAITQMSEDDFFLLNGTPRQHPVPQKNTVAVIGPGTGLGVSGLVPNGQGRMIALSGEGGHVTFSPYDQLERDLLSFAKGIFGHHVSTERLLQGQGLVLIYRFMAKQINAPERKHTPAEVTHGALVEHDSLCIDVLSRYCAILGDFCANVVLTIGGIGGVYLSGGIVPRFIDFLQQSDFRRRFEDKGRFAEYLHHIPVYIVIHPNPGLLGAAVALHDELNTGG